VSGPRSRRNDPLLAWLLAGLATIGPFSIDTYLPSFPSIGREFAADPLVVQQTLSLYLASFGLMTLFHGALSDALGRRPVILACLAVFALASAGCALAPSIEALLACRVVQGMSAGAGMVVGRAIIRDTFDGAQAQRLMSQVTMIFGLAPAIAPMIGGWLYLSLGWAAIFWFLVLYAWSMAAANWWLLPESLAPERRQSIAIGPLLAAYRQLVADRRFLLLALASGVPFNAFFLYVLSAPAFLGQVLGLGPQQFFWLFVCSIAGIMIGAWLSGRLAGRIRPQTQVMIGFLLMAGVGLLNLANQAWQTHSVLGALLPVGILSLGWSLLMPAVTLLVLDLFPERRGMASSLQSVVSSIASALVAGLVSPLVMHSGLLLAAASLALVACGGLSWWAMTRWWPEALHFRTQL